MLKKLALFLLCVVLFMIATALTAHASPTRGAGFTNQVIQPAHATVFSNLGYKEGEVIAIDVTAERGNIDCILFNHRGKIIAKDETPTNGCHFALKSPKAEIYILMVTNIDSDTPATATIVIQ
jgi:hypothetical protein